MGEYSRATLAGNLATIPGNVDSTKTMDERSMECFRVVDTVLAKVIQVQRLHMNLFCEFVAFSDTDKRKDAVEKQRKECEHLEVEMRSLMNKMLKHAMDSKSGGSKVHVLPSCTEEIDSPLSNPESSTFKCDPWIEIKQENDTELIDENGNVEFSCAVMLGSDQNPLQSSGPFVGGAVSAEEKIRGVGFSQNSEFVSPKEWDNAFAVSVCINSQNETEEYSPHEILPDAYEDCGETGGLKKIEYQSETCGRSANSENVLVPPAVPPDLMSSKKDIPENRFLSFDKNAYESIDEGNYDILEASVKTEDCAESRSAAEFNMPVIREHGSSTKHECELCSKQFNRKDNLTAHMRRHTCEKPYECEVCSNKFRDRRSLAVHMRIHNGEKPYECEVCRRRFRQASNLSTHMRMHNGEKPFVCKVCSRKFSEAGSLITHIRIHSGERPYECEVCARKFSQSGSLKRHVRLHSGGKPFECEVCSRKFSQRSHLASHMRRHNSGKP